MTQKLNSYTLEVYPKSGKPCFVVNINHVMLAGMFFFNNMTEARNFIHKKRESLERFAPLTYDENGIVDKKGQRMLFDVLNNDDIAIGTNGRTYSKTLFPEGV